MKSAHAFIAAAISTSVLLAGCSSTESATPGESDGETITRTEVSWVKKWGSLDELVKASPLVVAVEATADQEVVGADSTGYDDITATLTTVNVKERLAGESEKSFVVRQTGTSKMIIDGAGDLLAPGETYLLFLQPFSFAEDGESNGEWIPTGSIRVYHLEGGDYIRTATSAPALPKTLDASDPLKAQ